MCLACELDALWYADWEQQSAAGAAGSAGVPPALSGEPDGMESAEAMKAGETLASHPSVPFGDEAAGPPARFVAAGKRSGGTPVLRAASRFRCEEAE
jgi:hypothetical protein